MFDGFFSHILFGSDRTAAAVFPLQFYLLVMCCTVQALAASADVAPFICGAVAGEEPLGPGATWRGTMEVDMAVCGDDAVFTTVSMLGESHLVWCYDADGG